MVHQDVCETMIGVVEFLKEFPINCFVQINTHDGVKVARVDDVTAIVDGEPLFQVWIYPSVNSVDELKTGKNFGELSCYFATEMKRLA